MIKIKLPFPPTVNQYWRHPVIGRSVRHLIGKRGRRYRKDVLAIFGGHTPMLPAFVHDIAVTITLHPPDRRKRDVDNFAKGLLDACTHAGLWLDDSQIQDLRIIMGEPEKGGSVILEVEEL